MGFTLQGPPVDVRRGREAIESPLTFGPIVKAKGLGLGESNDFIRIYGTEKESQPFWEWQSAGE
jgi:hypothetical protein